MSKVINADSFAGKAVNAFEDTYTKLFEQSREEVERLDRINTAMSTLENSLLDPERIATMEPMQQIALAQMLTNASTATIKNLMQFGGMFMNIRTIVGMLDGVQKPTTTIDQGPGNFPGIEGRENNPRLE